MLYEVITVLADREEVGHHLAGMVHVGQPIDDRDVGPAREFLDRLLGEGANSYNFV